MCLSRYEEILHLLPSLKSLIVVLYGPDLGLERVHLPSEEILCDACCAKHRKLTIVCCGQCRHKTTTPLGVCVCVGGWGTGVSIAPTNLLPLCPEWCAVGSFWRRSCTRRTTLAPVCFLGGSRGPHPARIARAPVTPTRIRCTPLSCAGDLYHNALDQHPTLTCGEIVQPTAAVILNSDIDLAMDPDIDRSKGVFSARWAHSCAPRRSDRRPVLSLGRESEVFAQRVRPV